MAVGDVITAARYNSMQTTIKDVLGTGSTDRGYGQTVTSTQVAAQDTVTASNMSALRSDIRKTYVHQTGIYPTSALINSGDIVVETDAGSGTGWKEYEDFVSSLDSNRLTADATRMSTTNKINYTRGSTWNGTLTHTFTVTFANANDRRYFFNTGGQIRVVISIPGATTPKDNDWNDMLDNLGTLRFGQTTTKTGTGGTFTNINNSNVTGSNQITFADDGEGVYSTSDFDVGVLVSGSVFTFQIVVRDDALGGTDEAVTDLNITVDEFKPNSGLDDGLTITSPTFSAISVA